MTSVKYDIQIKVDGNQAAVNGFEQVTQATAKTGDAAVLASKKITDAQKDVATSAAQTSLSQKNLGESMAQAGTTAQQVGQNFDQVTQATTKTGDAAALASKKITLSQKDVAASAAQLSLSQKNLGATMAQTSATTQQVGQKIVSSHQQTSTSTAQLAQTQQRFTDSLTKQSEAIGKTNSQLALMRAQQLGVADAAAPMIAKLAQAEQGVQRVGMSAAATAAAMRNVPAQFTDIVTSLQGGQSPLTVFMQQGGQLKDMFGGAGNAAKALGGYVLGLVNPFTVAAAAVVGLGAAYYYGAQEAKEFQKNIITSGGAAGVTVNQMIDLAAKINDLGIGSKSLAGESLNALVSAGNVSSSVIEKAAIASIKSQRLLGVSVVDTAKEFSELGKTPVASIEKLNDKYHFLTLEVYEQIKALEEQGKSAEAAKLAQSSYADALINQSQKVNATLSDWEKGWNRIKAATTGAVDAVFNIGREDSSAQKISKLLVARENLEGQRKGAVKNGEGGYYVGKIDEQLAQNKILINQERAKEDAIKAKAKAQENANIAFEAGKQFSKDGEKYLSKEAQTTKEITKAKELWLASGKKLSDQTMIDREAAIRASIGLSTEVTAYNELAKAVRDKLISSNLELTAEKSLTEAQKDRLRLQEFIAVSHGKISKEKLAAIATDIETIRGNERMQFMQAEAQASMTKFSEAQVKRTKDFVDGFKSQYEATVKMSQSIDDYATSMANLNEQTQFELTLLGKSERDRKIALEQFKVELELKKQIKAINDSAAFDADKPGLIQKATQAAESRKESIVVQVDTGEMLKARKDLDSFLDPAKAQSFGDALRGAFNGAGDSLSKLTSIMLDYSAKQAASDAARADAAKGYATDNVKLAQVNAQIAAKEMHDRLGSYGDMANAAKGFFDENSNGYKTLDGVAKAFHTAQLAMTLAQNVQSAIGAVLTQASGDPYTAFARMAAMAAVVGAIGFAVGGGFNSSSGGTSAKDVQKSQGAGGVFGDSEAKSESISKSLEVLEKNSGVALSQGSGMLSALRSIESSMRGVTNLLVRSNGLTDGTNLGIKEGKVASNFGAGTFSLANSLTGGLFASVVDPLGKLIQNLWGGTKTNIVDAGLQFGGSARALQKGQGISQYASVDTTKSSWFGLVKNTSNSVQTQGLSDEMSSQFGKIFTGVEVALQGAAVGIGMGANHVSDVLNNLTLSTTKISLKGLKGQELTDAISSVVSKSMDEMAQAAVKGLEEFQQVGEGYFQTLIRVSSALTTTNAWLSMLKQRLYDVSIAGAKSAQSLADAFGGLDKLTEASQAFYETYFSDGERAAASMASMSAALATVNLTLPETKDQLKAMAQGLDLNTAAGRAAYAILLQIAPEFATAANAISEQSKVIAEKLIATFTGNGNLVPALDSVKLSTDGLITSLTSDAVAAGAISRLFLDAESGLLHFGGGVAGLQQEFTGAQLSVAFLNSDIVNLRLNADKTKIDIAGLNTALANVSTETFMTTVALVFESLASRIKGVIDGISTERIALREAAIQIINPTVMSKDAIGRGINGLSIGLPSNSGLVAANAALGATDASEQYWKNVTAAALVPYKNAQAALDIYKNTANSGTQSVLEKSTLVKMSGRTPTVNQELYASNGAYRQAWDEQLNAHWARFGQGYNSDSNGSVVLQQLQARLAPAIAAEKAAANAAFTASVQSQQANLNNLQTAYNNAAATLASAQANNSAAVIQARAAQIAYADALQNFTIDASKSVGKLSNLRTETLKYYEAQKQLADLMTNSAASLRGSVADYKYNQLSPEQQFNDLQAKYASAYAMALSTDGTTLAGYGDKLNGMLTPLLEKAKEIYGSGTAYDAFVATTLARADNIAGRLETLTPTNYAADSLAMLGQIDATLVALDGASKSAEKIISDAIKAGSDKTAAGLHAVIAALTGQSIPGFASGGDFGGGLRIVGENGPELEATGPSRIFNANQTRSILSGGGNTERLEALVERLTEEVIDLRAEARATASNTNKMAKLADKADQDGVRINNEAPIKTVAA